MRSKSQKLLLLVLTLTLLLIVSARVSPGSARQSETETESWEVTPIRITAPPAEETPEPTPTEAPRIREQLPDVSLTDWNLKLINNTYVVGRDFVPNVTEVRDGQQFDVRAADALEEMLSGAEAAGYTVSICAAYRPYQTQATLFFGRASIIAESQHMPYGEAVEQLARSIVAYPGTSDHQTALGADIMDSASTDRVAEDVEDLPVLKWLQAHCAEYGFILRYPKNKQEITGWYEPWHFRYVGKEAAAYIMEHDLCLEEFYEQF